MGSKTSEDEHRGQHDNRSNYDASFNGGGRPRGVHTDRDGDGTLGDGGDEDRDDDHADKDAEAAARNVYSTSVAEPIAGQKKRKKSKTKKNNKAKESKSSPPRIPLSDLFPGGVYSQGEIQSYTRIVSVDAERRYAAQAATFNDEFLKNCRKAAEVHRQTRKWVRDTLKGSETETFGSTGCGYVRDDSGVYGYGLHEDAPLITMRENFGTIVFCRRYLDHLGWDKYLAGMNCLISNGIVEQNGQLTDVKGSYSAQFEHTFLMRETCKEVLSRGDDY
ncbi:hypothetical protein NLU13_1361 [Sarocladium strictum]|uniref:Uncharacterized protein n=1 Tax=Sarocladium strictum TaxID=5046 RepID=A0AA39LC70_SARSR|nr:hypothetical protein NLU13_1361 [Sarocladium strictum]